MHLLYLRTAQPQQVLPDVGVSNPELARIALIRDEAVIGGRIPDADFGSALRDVDSSRLHPPSLSTTSNGTLSNSPGIPIINTNPHPRRENHP